MCRIDAAGDINLLLPGIKSANAAKYNSNTTWCNESLLFFRYHFDIIILIVLMVIWVRDDQWRVDSPIWYLHGIYQFKFGDFLITSLTQMLTFQKVRWQIQESSTTQSEEYANGLRYIGICFYWVLGNFTNIAQPSLVLWNLSSNL